MDLEEATFVLRVSLPISESALKSAFRRRCHETHPDKNPGKDSHEFLKVQEAFTVLNGSDCILRTDFGSIESQIISGINVSELGRGYPMTEPAITCDECRGFGYKEQIVPINDCTYCQGQGTYREVWKNCECGPLFLRPSRYCRRCRGSGRYVWLRLKREIVCEPCKGTGSTLSYKIRSICKRCDGVGEVKMWNPVLHRGMLRSS